ncbi:MAG: hypothetical protein WAT19_04940 [Ferruginibacter sp.]
MKKLFLLFAVLSLGINAEAQLLKKLKEKAEKALESKPKENSSSSSNKTEATEEPASQNSAAKESKQPAAPPSNGSVVFTLGNDETFFYDETSIIAKNNAVSYQFVVSNKKYEYFLIDNGKRTGPFKEAPPIKSMKTSDDEYASSNEDDDKINMGGEQKDPVSMQYTKTIGGKLHIAFNGKNYGPYDYVGKMLLSPDKKQFFALVVMGGENAMMYKMGMGQYYMVNEKGLKQKIGGGMGMGLKFSASNGFVHCMASVMDNKTQQIYNATSAGKQTEGSMADLYSGEKNKTMVSDKGDIISIPAQSPTQILVNGDEAARFAVPVKSLDRLFLMPDVSKSVYYSGGKLYKADGTTVSTKGIMYPKVVTVNNEVVMYYFKIYQNESGAKDVYLCKTVI